MGQTGTEELSDTTCLKLIRLVSSCDILASSEIGASEGVIKIPAGKLRKKSN